METILSPRKRSAQTITTVINRRAADPVVPAITFDNVNAPSHQSLSLPNSPKSKSKFLCSNNGNYQGNSTYRCTNDVTIKSPHSFILHVVLNSISFKKLPHEGKFTFR